MFFKEGAGDECAAAVAILLFGNTDTILPGGYAGEEMFVIDHCIGIETLTLFVHSKKLL